MDFKNDLYDMESLKKMIKVIVSKTNGISEESIKNIYDFYIIQLERIHKYAKMYGITEEKKMKLNFYIKNLKDITNENPHIKDDKYDVYITKRFKQNV